MARSASPGQAIVRAAVWIVVGAACYFAAQYIVAGGYYALQYAGVAVNMQSPISLLVFRLLTYIVMAALLALAVWYRCRKVSLDDAALSRLPSWKDLGLVLPAAIVYVVATVAVAFIAGKWFGVDLNQAQDLGFSALSGSELLLGFIVLVVLTPIFEEAIFRGFLYGRLRRTALPWWVPALVVSALFGVAHGQWNVGLDVFVLSMVACGLREVTGSIWAGIVLHMAKNMLAFMLTFVFVSGIAG